MSQGNGNHALATARGRVAMAQLIGWRALEQSWQRTVDELVATGGEERLAASYAAIGKISTANSIWARKAQEKARRAAP